MDIKLFTRTSIQQLSDKQKGQIILLDQTLEEQRWSSKVWRETWEDFAHFSLQTYTLEDDLIAFGLWTLPPMEEVMHLLKIVVLPMHRGKGVAGQLFENMLLQFPQKGVFLEVKVSNAVAINFYQKHGLRILNKARNYYGAGKDAYKMFKAALPNA